MIWQGQNSKYNYCMDQNNKVHQADSANSKHKQHGHYQCTWSFCHA